MATSPTRLSDKSDDPINKSPTMEKCGINENYSSKHGKVCKDEGSDKTQRDSFLGEINKRKDIKRKRSRSPIQEPSSSKFNIESTKEGGDRNEKQNSESDRNESSRPFHSVKDNDHEFQDVHPDRYQKRMHSRSKSPISINVNERYARSYPPGAKGKINS